MRILHVVENLERGGLERVVADLARMQRDQGHEVRVACLFGRGLLAAELEAAGIEVLACGKRSGLDLAAIGRLRKLLLEERGGILHTHNAAAHYHAMLAAARVPFTRIVNTRHGMGIARPRSRREWLYRRAMRGTDYVVAVCEAARARYAPLRSRARTRLLAVPNGIRVDRFRAADPSRRARLAAALDLGTDARLAGTVGRLEPVKDQAMLLRAFARLHEAMPCAALLLVGDGALRGALEALAGSLGIEHRVRFLGDRDDVPELLGGLDLFVLPSRSEGYSIALLEACASGLPIVATDVGGNSEIVVDGRNGRLVPAGDEQALADAMHALLADPPEASRLGRAGREWAMAEASLQVMAERYQRLYEGRPGHATLAAGTAS